MSRDRHRLGAIAAASLVAGTLAIGCGRYAPPIRPEAPAPPAPAGWDNQPATTTTQPEPEGWDLEATPGNELPADDGGAAPTDDGSAQP